MFLLLAALGAVLIVAGVGLLSVPAGVITAGVMLVVVGLLAEDGDES